MAARLCLMLLLAATAAACGGDEPVRKITDPHTPRTGDERFLSGRYRELAVALERGRAAEVCPWLEPALADAYRCDAGTFRLPRELRRVDVSLDEIFAVQDPLVPDVIQISSELRAGGNGRLIVFFREDRDGWQVSDVMVGGYG